MCERKNAGSQKLKENETKIKAEGQDGKTKIVQENNTNEQTHRQTSKKMT